MATRNDRFVKGPSNKKRNGQKGLKAKDYQPQQSSKAIETENDYSRALNSSRWKSWHNTIRDIDSRGNGKEWKRHYPPGPSKQMHPARHSHSRNFHHTETAHYSVSYHTTVQSFHMELDESDFGHPIPWEHPMSDVECDLELKSFLSETYQAADIVLTTHATKAQERIEKERRLATEKWLMSRTPEERMQYLQRQATNIGE
jgi:hypothetical protein